MLSAIWVGLAALPAGSSDERPNVVLLLTDDQGYGDLGCTGNPCLDTPALDRLASQSARWQRFYVCPVCSPTRASLMTGRDAPRTGVVDTWVGRSMMDPGEDTLAERLRDAGYRTGIFGKWHLGDHRPMRPGDQGFERSLVHYGGGLAQPSEPPENEGRYTDPILLDDGVERPTEGYCTEVYFDAALDFIDRADGAPFFVYLPTNAPHGPLHDVPEDLYRKYRDRDLSPVLEREEDADRVARIYAMIEDVDRNVGRLLRHLDRAGLAENTLVLFLLDNGPQGRRFNGGLRGSKTQVFEGGIRSVFFARWPARWSGRDVGPQPAAHIDVLPTVLEAAGVRTASRRPLDGRSLLPMLLHGEDPRWTPRTLFVQVHRGSRPLLGRHFAALGPRYKLVQNSGFGGQPPRAAPQLFDLIADPGETVDLSERLPQVTASLQAQYEAWFSGIGGGLPERFEPPRIELGAPETDFLRLSKQDWRVEGQGGWGRVGTWKLRGSSASRYQAEVLFSDAVQGELELRVGELVVAGGTCPEGTRRHDLGPVELPAGDFDLRVELQHGGERQGPHQLLLRRR